MQDLRSDDWQAIWPELVTNPAAPVIHHRKGDVVTFGERGTDKAI